MTEIEFVVVDDRAREYWCPACRQLRLAPTGETSECGNCRNREGIVAGAPGELNADALRSPEETP